MTPFPFDTCMNRFGFFFASVVIAACTDETSSVRPPRDWPALPGRELDIVDVLIDEGGLPFGTVVRHGTADHDEFRDVAITADARGSIRRPSTSSRSPQPMAWSRSLGTSSG
jgi:hypothetical protein